MIIYDKDYEVWLHKSEANTHANQPGTVTLSEPAVTITNAAAVSRSSSASRGRGIQRATNK